MADFISMSLPDSGMNGNVAAAGAMDRMYRHQRHFYDATRKYYLLGRDLLIDRLRPKAGDCVLEVGCGTGRNLIRAARQYPQARFYGIDISGEMLATAREQIARAGLSSRVQVAQGDATCFDTERLFGIALFQRVFMSYTLSMIPRWRAVLEQATASLAASGQMLIVDFGGQEGLPVWFRPLLAWWLSLFHVTPRAELELELTILADRKDAVLNFERPYRGYAQYAMLRMPD
jgi:S-adenosylmethionine-diacylgycerolhomoserine-N-methlytransferase